MATNLSPRQREILGRVANGRTSKEIAADLGISVSTVNWHLGNALTRLGATTRAQAVARWHRVRLRRPDAHLGGTPPVQAEEPKLIIPPTSKPKATTEGREALRAMLQKTDAASR